MLYENQKYVVELSGFKTAGPSIDFVLKCVYILIEEVKSVSKVTWD
jgi:hypothetical protein